MVDSASFILQTISEWVDAHLVKFNAIKTQVCLIKANNNTVRLPVFQNVFLEYTDRVQSPGIEVSLQMWVVH